VQPIIKYILHILVNSAMFAVVQSDPKLLSEYLFIDRGNPDNNLESLCVSYVDMLIYIVSIGTKCNANYYYSVWKWGQINFNVSVGCTVWILAEKGYIKNLIFTLIYQAVFPEFLKFVAYTAKL
jgi:hypothetical protein